ncbi:MAG: hypothetical protein GX445_00205 [Elusimicrobia bacterium]|nr:hypothetical protein [Elusimicrobiota bacterium]
MKKLIIISLLCFCSCSNVEVIRPTTELFYSKYPDYVYMESAHFIINAPSDIDLKYYSLLAERFYYNIMMDTNLFSFVPAHPYRIIIHKDKNTFLTRTGSFDWSGGFIKDNIIETYISPTIDSTLAHEITHLILNEFIGENIYFYSWLSEGLATYEERKASSDVDIEYENIFRTKVIPSPYRFTNLISFIPKKETSNDEVKKYYAESSDIIKFMINREGSFKFYIFLDGLKRNLSLDNALKNAYPTSFTSVSALERIWLRERVGI